MTPRKWQEMTVEQLANGIENAEIDMMGELNRIIEEFSKEYELNVLDINVTVKYAELGVPPRVVNVSITAPVRAGVM